MAKARTDFRCRECGYQTPRPLGRCPECEAWASFDEVNSGSARPTNLRSRSAAPLTARPVRLDEVATADLDRIPVPMAEFARVLGGGIVPGSVTLIGGDPGVGKSTLLTQMAAAIP